MPVPLEGELGVYTGASRQGKTAALKQKVRKHGRVIVWSVKETVDKYAANWPDAKIARNLGALKAHLMQRCSAKRERIIYVPESLADFEGWAKLAYAWGNCGHANRLQTTTIAEELADVTTPAKAPESWGVLVRQGLGYGINIYAVTQRPAESDKTIMGNATYIHAHYVQRANDRAYIAREMDVDPEAINALNKLEWIEKWGGEKDAKRGKVRF